MTKGKLIQNSLVELTAAVRMSSLMTGGSSLSNYGTIQHANNYSLISLNRVILTYLYTGNGIFQTAIELPVHDALGRGIDIECDELSPENIDDLLEWMECPFEESENNQTPWEVIKNAFVWARLYGGGAIVVNTNEDPETPLTIDQMDASVVEMYDFDRWQIDAGCGVEGFNLEINEREYYTVNGSRIHKSRVLKVRGKRAPYQVRRQLRGWGMSEGERMIRDINLYLKTQDVGYEILDEAKIDVYKIKNFAQKLIQRGGVERVKNRVLAANELKNYLNALVLDSEEDYIQKTLSFTGISDVMRENRIGIASALRMPMTKLFGLSASGFNTGESDLENYNSMVESEIRTPMRPLIRKILSIGMMKLFGHVPAFKFFYPSLRTMTTEQEEAALTAQQARALAMFDRNILTASEVAEIGKKEGWLSIDPEVMEGFGSVKIS